MTHTHTHPSIPHWTIRRDKAEYEDRSPFVRTAFLRGKAQAGLLNKNVRKSLPLARFSPESTTLSLLLMLSAASADRFTVQPRDSCAWATSIRVNSPDGSVDVNL